MIDKIKENWEKILLILKEEHEVSDVSYRTWLQPLTPYEFKGNTVTIIVPEQTFLAYVKKEIRPFTASYHFRILRPGL